MKWRTKVKIPKRLKVVGMSHMPYVKLFERLVEYKKYKKIAS